MFGLGLFDYLKLGAGMALGAALAFYPAILIGRSEGRQQAATAAISKSVEILRARNQINDEVSSSDASALCAALGLSIDEQAECVRRLGEATAEPGNVSNNPPH